MAQGGNSIPIAKMLTPDAPEPWRYVTPLGYEWWEKMTPLEQAHREGRLFCPYCGGRVLYCCGQVKVPYFRHPENSCLMGGPTAGDLAGPRTGARASMFRFGLARLLLEVLPRGTILNQKRAFLGAEEDEDLLFTLPSDDSFIVVVECNPDGYATLTERMARYAARAIPIYWVFCGDLHYRTIREAGRFADTRLDPLAVTIMQWGDLNRMSAEPYVDLAYEAATVYPFQKVSAPGSLLFYQPGNNRRELGMLIGLRGVLPAPMQQNRWFGAVVRGEVSHGKAHQIRFSRRRGFYFEQDLILLRAYRKQRTERRIRERQQKAEAETSARLRADLLEEERKRRLATQPVSPALVDERKSYHPTEQHPRSNSLSGSPRRTLRKNITNGMVQGCPVRGMGPVRLDNCTYCDYRCGGDTSSYMICGWPRRR